MKLYSSTLLFIILSLIFIWISLLWWKGKFYNQYISEGFSQDKTYSLATGNDIYDDFYADVFDDLTLADSRTQYTWDAFRKAVQPASNARFLDIGAGTGNLVRTIRQDGFDCVGIDLAPAMAASMQDSIVKGDFLDPMAINNSDFFAAFCLGMTIYELTDEQKRQLFKNTFFWLRSGGYFMIHLVDVDKFSPAVPLIASSTLTGDSPIFSADVNFGGFSYKYDFDIDESQSQSQSQPVKCACAKSVQATQTETFTDLSTGKVRENNIELYLSAESDIVKMIESAGFGVVGKWNLRDSVYRDSFQYFYLFSR